VHDLEDVRNLLNKAVEDDSDFDPDEMERFGDPS
jgi:hypothetical protein